MSELLSQLAKTVSATFASFVYTSKGTGEVAKYRLILGANTTTLYEKDIAQLKELILTLEGDPLALQAANELLASRVKSLLYGIGNNPDYTNKDTYIGIPGIKGVRIHKDTRTLYVSGLQEGKETITPGVYKSVKSSPKTIAKRRIEKGLPSGRYRLFKLENVQAAALHGDTLTLTTS